MTVSKYSTVVSYTLKAKNPKYEVLLEKRANYITASGRRSSILEFYWSAHYHCQWPAEDGVYEAFKDSSIEKELCYLGPFVLKYADAKSCERTREIIWVLINCVDPETELKERNV